MLAWSPILIQQIEIHALGFVLRKLQLNRHREAEVASHHHVYAQLILYLSGEGVQTVNGKARSARAGDLFVIPAGVSHGFALAGRSRPLCLVLDYEVEGPARTRTAHRKLPQATLNELHRLLAQVPAKGRLTLAHYSVILAVVARLLDQARRAPSEGENRVPGLYEKVSTLLRSSTSVAKVARAAGYHPDHLNRKLKREAGLGVRALRDRLRLENAQSSLRRFATIAEAATHAGFDDPNYFTRWFRKQTGQPPGIWRRR